jgi:hypothetical protein
MESASAGWCYCETVERNLVVRQLVSLAHVVFPAFEMPVVLGVFAIPVQSRRSGALHYGFGPLCSVGAQCRTEHLHCVTFCCGLMESCGIRELQELAAPPTCIPELGEHAHSLPRTPALSEALCTFPN